MEKPEEPPEDTLLQQTFLELGLNVVTQTPVVSYRTHFTATNASQDEIFDDVIDVEVEVENVSNILPINMKMKYADKRRSTVSTRRLSAEDFSFYGNNHSNNNNNNDDNTSNRNNNYDEKYDDRVFGNIIQHQQQQQQQDNLSGRMNKYEAICNFLESIIPIEYRQRGRDFITVNISVNNICTTFYLPDSRAVCHQYSHVNMSYECMSVRSNWTKISLCQWEGYENRYHDNSMSSSLSSLSYCKMRDPPSFHTNTLFYISMLLLTTILSLIIALFMKFILEEYCSKRPRLEDIGLDSKNIEDQLQYQLHIARKRTRLLAIELARATPAEYDVIILRSFIQDLLPFYCRSNKNHSASYSLHMYTSTSTLQPQLQQQPLLPHPLPLASSSSSHISASKINNIQNYNDIQLIQYLSPACRISYDTGYSNLISSHILQQIKDTDVEQCTSTGILKSKLKALLRGLALVLGVCHCNSKDYVGDIHKREDGIYDKME
eukprot:gene13918-29605_t